MKPRILACPRPPRQTPRQLLAQPGSQSMKRRRSPTPHRHEYVLVIDTETTGLPSRNANPAEYTLYDNARMVEVAWAKYTLDGQLYSRESYLVNPTSPVNPHPFVIPAMATRIHGITMETATAEGETMEFIWEQLGLALNDVVIVVAHNMDFDNRIVLSEMYRSNANTNLIQLWRNVPKECTMKMGQKQNGGRWPKLAVLHHLCFNEEPQGTLHRAAEDTSVCARIYFHMRSQPRPQSV